MKRTVSRALVVTLLFLGSVAGTAASADVDMQEGEWETAAEMTMVGGPISMPPITSKSTQCITRENPVPASEKDKDCKVTRHKVVGNKVSWRVVCGKSEGEGEITYKGSTFKGTTKIKTEEDGQAVTTLIKLTGRRIGPCTGGKKSGAAGKDAEKYKAMAESAMAEGKQRQAEQEEIARKTEAFFKRSVVPAEDPGACVQEGIAKTPGCEERMGKLVLKPGEYEFTLEQASRVGPTYTPVEVKNKNQCLTGNNPVPGEIVRGRSIREVKWGKDKITWKHSSDAGLAKAGIVYRETSFEGVEIQTREMAPDSKSITVTKITGRRIGDGDCVSEGRDYTSQGRGYTAGQRTKGLLNNPVKGIRNLFGF